jgi:hypothetical protein
MTARRFWRERRAPRWSTVLNALLVAASFALAAALVSVLVSPRHLPVWAPRTPSTGASARGVAAVPPVGDASFETYGIVLDRPLFNPTRSSAKAVAIPAGAPPPPLPVLHGVLLDGARSLAYLEDVGTRRILSYEVGDEIAGGQVESIAKDRVRIRRAGESVRIMLNHPGRGPIGQVPRATPRAR